MAKVIKPVILDETAQVSNVRLAEIRDAILNGGGGGGTGGNYNTLTNKPKINGVELQGSQSGAALGLQDLLTAGSNITISTSLTTGLTTISATAGEPAQYLKSCNVSGPSGGPYTVRLFNKDGSYTQFTTGGGGSSYAEGNGIIIDTTVSPNTISVDNTTIAEVSYVDTAVAPKATKTYVDTQDTALQTNIDKKQDILSDSGTTQNIKTIDGGSIIGTGDLGVGTLTSAITVTNSVGNVTAGTTLPVGTRLEAIIKDMLTINSTTAYLTFVASPTGAGHFDKISGSYTKGVPVSVTAIGDGDYVFTKWSDGDTSNPRTITPTADATFTAEFTASHVTLTIAVDDPTHGTITPSSGQYTPGTTLTLTPTPATGFVFEKWIEDDTTDNPRIITVPNTDATYTAKFKPLTAVPTTFAKGAVFYRAIWDEENIDWIIGNLSSATITTNKTEVEAEFATATKENCFWYNPSAKVTYTDAEKAAMLIDENGITVGVNEGEHGESCGWYTVFLCNFGQDPAAIRNSGVWQPMTISEGGNARKCSLTVDGIVYDAYIFNSLTQVDEQIRFKSV